eukprot:77602_1
MLMVPAIVAIIIAATYEKSTSPCGDPSYCPRQASSCHYTIGLDAFLFIVGGTQIAYALYFWWVGYGQGSQEIYGCSFSIHAVEGLFLFIMAIIGFIMWIDQFSDACKGQPIAIMILTWSIIPFVHLVVAFFCPYAGTEEY